MADTKTAALDFRDENLDVTKDQRVERRLARDAFLKALCRYDPGDTLAAWGQGSKQLQRLQDLLQQMTDHHGGKIRRVKWIPYGDVGKLSRSGSVFRGDPLLERLAWMRRRVGPAAFSISGVTHALCDLEVQSGIADYLMAPLESWDALVCTSQAARRVVLSVCEAMAAYSAERLATSAALRPTLQLPVIPLGVHCDECDTTTVNMQALRHQVRAQMEIAASDVCVLFVGRLSQFAKANPRPMYRALQAAAQRTKRKVHLMMAGRFADASVEQAFREGAVAHCPDVACHFVGDSTAAMRSGWASADIFTSLADSVEESFGPTPLEAMAAGLPVVASDWNGCRETVRDGTDGILVPTTFTPSGFGASLAFRHSFNISTHATIAGELALNAAVDQERAAEAYAALIGDQGLRQRMGEAGRRRARETFDWSRIYPQYRELWGELEARRRAADTASSRSRLPLLPRHPDPFRTYGHYATHTFDLPTRLRLVPRGGFEAWRASLDEKLLSFEPKERLDPTELKLVFEQLDTAKESALGELAAALPEGRRDVLVRTVTWLLKADLVILVDPIAVPGRPAPLT